MSTKFPSPIPINGRNFFSRRALEAHKSALAGLPEKAAEGPDVFVPARQVAAEFGVCVRTITRWTADSQAAAA
jgi:hypothetical protein